MSATPQKTIMDTKTNIYTLEFYDKDGKDTFASIDFTDKEVAKYYYLAIKENNPKYSNVIYWKTSNEKLINVGQSNDETLKLGQSLHNLCEDEVYFNIFYIDYGDDCGKNIIVALKLPESISYQLSECKFCYAGGEDIDVSISFDKY